MLPDDVKQATYDMEARKEIAETIITRSRPQSKIPVYIRIMAMDLIVSSINQALKIVTNMYMNEEINREEYKMMNDIIARVMRKIKTMQI